MVDAIRDPYFLLGVAGLILALVGPYLYRRRRSIQYRVWCNRSLLDQSEVEEGCTAVVHGRKRDASDLWVYVLEVSNLDSTLRGFLGGWSGTDISPSRFDRPISFTYGDGSRVLDQQVIDEEPDELGVNLRAATSKSTVIEPLLLNQQDSFTLRVIVEKPEVEQRWWGEEGEIDADGRIEGIRNIKRAPSTFDFLRWANVSIMTGGGLLIAMDFFVAPLLGLGTLPDYSQVEYGWLFSVGYGFAGGFLPIGILSATLFSWMMRQDKELYNEARDTYEVSEPEVSDNKR